MRVNAASIPPTLVLLALASTGCAVSPPPDRGVTRPTPSDVGADADPTMLQVLVTSEAGAKVAQAATVPFRTGRARGTAIEVFPDDVRQTIDGIGSSFTESSAFVLAHLDPDTRRGVMESIWGAQGANFSLARTHIGSCDFTVEGKYSYAEVAGDRELAHFGIAPDTAGFDPRRYPGVKDAGYDLLPMIHEALAIKRAQPDDDGLRIVASAWTAPPWMKTNETWYIPGSAENNWQGDGGWLKPEYVDTYADYLVAYLDAYREAGVEIWGLTPVNEPHGNNGQWESMHFSPESQNEFVKRHLGPRLHERGHGETKLMVYDQNRDGLEEWTDVIFADPETAPFVYGAAVHWYASTFKVFEETFERVHAAYPEFALMHTEGCIDDLGKDAPNGITDPVRFKESGWFGNDAFWWNPTATDWAYSATWAGTKADDHPIYTPVHRYARNIIVSLDHWVGGWIDWNVVLDRDGGPNHVGNFCGAPIMIDTATEDVYYTPVYWVLAQLSRTIRPGDRALRTERRLRRLDDDALHASATIGDDGVVAVQLLNTTKQPVEVALQLGEAYAAVTIPANALQTVRVRP